MRFVSVSEFRGKKYVNIREFYEKNGQLLPGKKGMKITIRMKRLNICIGRIELYQ